MKIIVTRPRFEADAWVKQLRALHFDAVALPLIHIGAAADTEHVKRVCESLHQYRVVMFVSSNAVRYFYPSNSSIAGVLIASNAIENIANLDNITDKEITNSRFKPRLWATGPGTREALLAQGEPSDWIDSPAKNATQFDSEALWNIVKNQIKPGDKVLIVRGSSPNNKDAEIVPMNGRPWLADQLTTAGAQVDVVVSYERSAPVFDAAQLALMTQAATDKSVWLFSSSEAVANLKALSESIMGINWSNARAIATHPRIAQAVKTAGFGVVYESRPLLADVVVSIESML